LRPLGAEVTSGVALGGSIELVKSDRVVVQRSVGFSHRLFDLRDLVVLLGGEASMPSHATWLTSTSADGLLSLPTAGRRPGRSACPEPR
jgi:hypothetical protein